VPRAVDIATWSPWITAGGTIVGASLLIWGAIVWWRRFTLQEAFKADLPLAQAAIDTFGQCLGPVMNLRSRMSGPEQYTTQMVEGRHEAAVAATNNISVHHEPNLKAICEELLTVLAQIRGQLHLMEAFKDYPPYDEDKRRAFEGAYIFLPRGFVETYEELQAAVRRTRAGRRWKRPHAPYFERMKARIARERRPHERGLARRR
jgi:hypothetical protein